MNAPLLEIGLCRNSTTERERSDRFQRTINAPLLEIGLCGPTQLQNGSEATDFNVK